MTDPSQSGLPALFSLAEVAEATGLSQRALEDGARARPPKFEHVRLGGRRWMTAEQVTALIQASTVTAAPAADPQEDPIEIMHRKLALRAARAAARSTRSS
jgi:hypothetical protein